MEKCVNNFYVCVCPVKVYSYYSNCTKLDVATVKVYATLTAHMYVELDLAKKVYLLVYNGVQWAGFILIVMSLLKCLMKGKGGPLTFKSQSCVYNIELTHIDVEQLCSLKQLLLSIRNIVGSCGDCFSVQ